jgi:hypothetical protein
VALETSLMEELREPSKPPRRAKTEPLPPVPAASSFFSEVEPDASAKDRMASFLALIRDQHMELVKANARPGELQELSQLSRGAKRLWTGGAEAEAIGLLDTLVDQVNDIRGRAAESVDPHRFDLDDSKDMDRLKALVLEHAPASASESNITKALNHLQDGHGKASAKLLGESGVLHVSAGKRDLHDGATLFFRLDADDESKATLLAIGQHTASHQYLLSWGLPGSVWEQSQKKQVSLE